MPGTMFAALRAGSSSVHSPLILLIMLAAFLAQTVAIQSHVHFAASTPVSHVATVSTGGAGQSLSSAPAGTLPDCSLCRELAMAGHYVLPDPVSTIEGRTPLLWLCAASVVALACRQRSHRWQSRAPPR